MMRKYSWFVVVAAIGSAWPMGCASSGRSIDPPTLGPASAYVKALGVT